MVNAPPRVEGLPLIKGPYGRITALDLNRGAAEVDGCQRRWPTKSPIAQIPQPATARRAEPACAASHEDASVLGEGSDAISGTIDAEWGWGKKFRAYDKGTGAVIA